MILTSKRGKWIATTLGTGGMRRHGFEVGLLAGAVFSNIVHAVLGVSSCMSSAPVEHNCEDGDDDQRDDPADGGSSNGPRGERAAGVVFGRTATG